MLHDSCSVAKRQMGSDAVLQVIERFLVIVELIFMILFDFI